MHSRRGFLKRSLGVYWTGGALLEQALFRATQARAQSRGDLPTLFNIQKMADGVYAAIAKPAAVLNCNAAIFENEKDLMIVDTHSKPSAVNALVAQIRREVSKKPVRYVVNSHFHWDHSQGTSAYKKIAPHADVIATETTRKLLSTEAVPRVQRSLEQMQKQLDALRTKRDGTKDAVEQRRLDRDAADIRAYIAEMKNYQPELPNITLASDLILHDKAHELHLAFRGRGHTAGDVVVFCPQKRAVATGDLLHGSLPFCGDGYPKEWGPTLTRVGELAFDKVAPGHGPVHDSKAVLYMKAGYLDELAAAIEGKRAKPVDQIQKEITVASLRSLSGDYGRYLMGNFKASSPAGDPAATLANGLRTNIADIHGALQR